MIVPYNILRQLQLQFYAERLQVVHLGRCECTNEATTGIGCVSFELIEAKKPCCDIKRF